MGRTRIEVCLISARGLKRTPSLFKSHWFSVAWIDPNKKYCTKVDSSSSSGNPTWKTKFSMSIDESKRPDDLAVHVEVYRREPIFLRQTLFGAATIVLKEFFDKYACSISNPSEVGMIPNKRAVVEEVGSFQLRKKGGGSIKPRGFVDVSIRIWDDEAACSSSFNAGVGEVFDVMHLSGCINLDNHSYGSSDSCQQAPPPSLIPLNNDNRSSFPMPSSAARGGQQRAHGPGFGLGLGMGALAAGSGLFGSGLRENAATARLTTISTDYPF